mmetsp:Transcript_128797/g.222543  ORF Transcript_128797/g.222543 Transcript_128797/m.222543 type:complete len:103 (+) Transcript_128797:160-468(+)
MVTFSVTHPLTHKVAQQSAPPVPDRCSEFSIHQTPFLIQLSHSLSDPSYKVAQMCAMLDIWRKIGTMWAAQWLGVDILLLYSTSDTVCNVHHVQGTLKRSPA